jgi:hypothetical protein
MKSLFVGLVTTSLFVAGALAQALTINTPPDAVECEPTLLTWSGGTPPYFLSVTPGATPDGTALEDLGQQNGTSFSWNTNIAAGTSVDLTLRDNTGAIAQSAPFTIQAGATTACVGLPQSSGAAGPTAPAATGPAATGPAATPPTTPTGTTPAGTPPPGTTNPSTGTAAGASSGTATHAASSAAATKSGAAVSMHTQHGAAGVLAAAILALLA